MKDLVSNLQVEGVKKLTHLTEMHVIINIQSFTCFNLLHEAKFLLATQDIFRLPSQGTNHDASVEQLTSNIKKKKEKWRR